MCGINGIWMIKNTTIDKKFLVAWEKSFAAIDARGGHASGFYLDGGRVIKAPVKAPELLRIVKSIDRNYGIGKRMILGHTRFATVGEYVKNYNNHPFVGDYFVMAHNGSHYSIKPYPKKKDLLYKVRPETDSWELLEAIEHNYYKTGDAKTAIETALNDGYGSYAVWLYDYHNDILYLFRDGNPLYIGRYKQAIFFASEKRQLPKSAQKNAFQLKNGYLYKITRNGSIKKQKMELENSYYYGSYYGRYLGIDDSYDSCKVNTKKSQKYTFGTTKFSSSTLWPTYVNRKYVGHFTYIEIDRILDELEYLAIEYEVKYGAKDVEIIVPKDIEELVFETVKEIFGGVY